MTFAMDSSGFSTTAYIRWFNVKYGWEMGAHDWYKLHLMCGVLANTVAGVEISGHDGPIPRCLGH
ncbi:MAG TPA: hypothetical protein VFU63_02340 [Ktedonobacterales bacterium]|nr:hypothetical protein [Ktedonobacterales bacterium]